MSLRREFREFRREVHEELSDPAFFAANIKNPVWIPITVRVVTKGDDPVDDVMGIMQVRSDNPSFIFIRSDAPGANADSVIHHEMGTFRMSSEPKTDKAGIAVVKTARLAAVNIAQLTAQPPEIIFEDDDE